MVDAADGTLRQRHHLDLGANGQVTLPASQVDNASSGNCGIASRTVSLGSLGGLVGGGAIR